MPPSNRKPTRQQSSHRFSASSLKPTICKRSPPHPPACKQETMGRGAAEGQRLASAAGKSSGAHARRNTAGRRHVELTHLERVQRQWQMASVAHFLEVFRNVLPLKEVSEDTAEDLTPQLLERGVADSDGDARACLALRDVLICLLVVIGRVSRKNMLESWFESLRVFVGSRRAEFVDCFWQGKNILERYETGMDFLVGVEWNVRLSVLLALCDIAAEESSSVREMIRECEVASTMTSNELEKRGVRLTPIGRCSQKRVHFQVGKTRIYSGHKRKGNGALVVECSDAETMAKLADALGGSGEVRDQLLAVKIRDVYLQPLVELEDRKKKRVERKRLAEIQREESRRRNAVRPRRSTAAYF